MVGYILDTLFTGVVVMSLVAFIVLNFGTSYAAQRSLPGDLLYAVKLV